MRSPNHPTPRIATALLALLCLCGLSRAALPPGAIESLQKGAPEKLTIEVTAAEKKEVNQGGAFVFEMKVEAKVVSVDSSAAGLKVGDTLKISYSFPNFVKSPAAGDWPGEVAKGKRYKAYLRVTDRKAKTADPAANSGSFE